MNLRSSPGIRLFGLCAMLMVVAVLALFELSILAGGELDGAAKGASAVTTPSGESLSSCATVTSTSTTASTTSTTSTTLPVSKSELKAAASAWADELLADPELTTCRLAIPRIDLVLPILEMTRESLLNVGPGHWPETPLPGMGGHFVLSGHRTLRGGPFIRLDELEAGDDIVVTLPYAEVRYQVTRTLIVGWEDVHVMRSRGLEELSLTTCHPIGRADSVMVVQAEAVDFRPIDGASTVARQQPSSPAPD